MSVIQNIRDKYARIAVIAIALSLVGFILMDALSGRSNLFGGNSTVVGKINGKEIEYLDFQRKVQAQEDQYKQQGMDMGEAGRQNMIEQVWNQELMTVLMGDQYEKVGIAVSTKEINDYLFGSNPPEQFRQGFTDSTGTFNSALAQQRINQIKKSGTAEDKAQLAQYVDALRNQRQFEKYQSLLTNSVYIPKWLIEKQTADNNLISSVSYVTVPYFSIPDSVVKVTDEDISRYVSAHRAQFEQKQETRSIDYVLFPATPSGADSSAALTAVSNLKPSLDTLTGDIARFLEANNSSLPYYDSYISRNAMRQANKDSIVAAPVGVTYGPYLDPAPNGNATWVLSKIVDTRAIPDTVKLRHILIATTQRNQQTGQTVQVRDDSSASKLADSLMSVIAAGGSFDALVTQFSDDPGSKDKAGVYENVTPGQMVAPFNDYAFTASIGAAGKVKTEFGYHIVEVLSTKGSSMGYKIAYLARPIEVSNQTENDVNNMASQFAADSRSLASFEQNVEKLRPRGLFKMRADNIRPIDFNINGIGTSRTLVRNIYEAGKADVLQPERVAQGYVVAVVTDVTKPGLQSAAQARSVVEPILRNQKKAQQIRKQIGAITTLEAVAGKVNQQVQTADSVHFNGNNATLGFEYKVIGAAFNPANKGKVLNEAIEGQAGVYVLRVNNVSAIASTAGTADQQRPFLTQQARQQAQGQNHLEALKNAATVKDYRAKFF